MNEKIISNINAARDLIHNGQEKMGLEKISEICSQNSNDSEAWLECAFTLDGLSKEEEAIPIYEKSLEIGLENDKEWMALTCLSSSYRNVGKVEKALLFIEQARDKYPDNATVNCFYSLILLDMKRANEAVNILGGTLLKVAKDGVMNGFERTLEEKFNELLN